MAKYPKKPKAPKSKSLHVWKRYEDRLRDWAKRVSAINKPRNEIRKIRDKSRGLRASDIK